jgi:hypothetical protein
MAYENPSVADFKAQFVRDFPYGSNINTSVTDTDIASAYRFTNIQINQELWSNQSAYSLGYLLLSAHYLVLNLRSASQGTNGQWAWLEQSKSVGQLNASFAIPQRVLDNPNFATLTKTNYGAEYLALLWPQLSGQMFTVVGSTRP